MIVTPPSWLEDARRPSLSSGYAHALPMTDKALAKAARKQPLGFSAPKQKKRKKGRK